MMGILWVVLFVALTGTHFGHGLPVGPTPQTYLHDENSPSVLESWGSGGGVYAAVPALALMLTAVGLLFGCTWCYRHKDCKLFAASATHLHEVRLSHPPDSGFSEPANNNISEDNNNGPISLREMQNIANNNAAAYIISENEERNRVSRESVVEFEPLPNGIRAGNPLDHRADWFGGDDFPRNNLQYLREIGRGWFGRVVEGEIEENGSTSTVAVKILNQNATVEDKARFLDEALIYRDARHENVLALLARGLQEDPWILIFELCPMDLQQYLTVNRPKMAILNESGVPLRLMCDVSSALAYLHSRGYLYGEVCCDAMLVRQAGNDPATARAVLGRYLTAATPPARLPHTASTEVWSLGSLVWSVCTWGAPPPEPPQPPPDLPCPYRNHLYQVMQLCWNPNPDARPTCAQVYALINHLYATHTRTNSAAVDDGYGSSDFEERWQRLKPNSIPVIDEHIAIVHAPSTSMASHFTGSDQDFDNTPTVHESLSVDMDTAVSRSSSIMSDKDPLSVQIKSESLTNLHGSLEDVRNIYLTHNEMAVLECHQGNISLDDSREKDHDYSDSSVDPWLKDIIAGSQDDVSYYKDVSDVIKNLDNILNSEKTSSSESSHQASPSRDNLSLDCKTDCPMQSSMVKSPGISNFQNILVTGFDTKSDSEPCEEDDIDRDTIGTLSHSFERHSDTTSQHTLENITPITPIKDINFICEIVNEIETAAKDNLINDHVEEIIFKEESKLHLDTASPIGNVVNNASNIPKLKELCVASMPSVSETNIEQLNVNKDCETPCDNKLTEERTEKETDTKSINDTELLNANAIPNTETEDIEPIKHPEQLTNVQDELLPEVINEKIPIINNSLLSIETTSDLQKEELTDVSCNKEIAEPLELLDIDLTKNEGETNDLISTVEDNIIEIKDTKNEIIYHEDMEKPDMTEIKENINLLTNTNAQTPEPVQNFNNSENNTDSIWAVEEVDNMVQPISNNENIAITQKMPPDTVQNCVHETFLIDAADTNIKKEKNEITPIRSEQNEIVNKTSSEQSNDSTVYMDLINNTNSGIVKNDTMDSNVKQVIKSCVSSLHKDISNEETSCSLVKNDSTVYLDLPSMIKQTDDFLHSEKTLCSQNVEFKDICVSSTPKSSDHRSTDETLECSIKDDKSELLSETKIPDYGPGVTLTKLEQKCVPDGLSPFESPTKSHHTDTYDENSSVVLGPFENCTIELFKGIKSIDIIDLPKEELLAFSSNFSEINLETPSPLRDGNFLNEVPDIVHDDVQFDDVATISDRNSEKELPSEVNTEESEIQSATEKHVSPSTPPNSPGNFLASTSQQKYLVDIDLNPPAEATVAESDSGLSSLQKEIELNQIELQITTKLAMAENENNLNIEYSRPLTVEGLVSEDSDYIRDSDEVPESYLAGNGGSVENFREGLTLDEECVKALRNELELKLPLAQVSGIEPTGAGSSSSGEWEPPPPPELVLAYPGALSPIAEETGLQLSAYENDANWTASAASSSESYPEPCNNWTEEDATRCSRSASPSATATYTLPGLDPHRTYTLHKDVTTSKEITMSADSLNASPHKEPATDVHSPIDDRTYNKNEEEHESNCERISQVSPFLLSPTTDTSAPDTTDNVDNGTGSTLSRTTVPTDAKISKPFDTQCSSKATSIDSWCSNDTLYNVEENFDDLAMDSDIPAEHEPEKEDEHSESSNTLTHNDDEKELSHCSTYIVHDSKSEACESFSPDSITANDNYTYTKAKTETTAATPSIVTKSEVDSTKNSQTKEDLAYGTLISGLPSYSNCTTEVLSVVDDIWKLQQPELVRRSPIGNEVHLTPPKIMDDAECIETSPQLTIQPSIKKMDSVEISCLQDQLLNSHDGLENIENQESINKINDSPNSNYKDMTPSVTSTPITGQIGNEDVEAIPIKLPDIKAESLEMNIPNFQVFLQSAEIRPQDISSNTSNECTSNIDTGIILEGDSKTLSKNSNKDSVANTERTPSYSDFENSAMCKPQDVHSREKSSQSIESGISSEEFRQFEDSVRQRPQDLSSVIDASSMLLKSERKSSELAMGSLKKVDIDQDRQPEKSHDNKPIQHITISPPNNINLNESHINVPVNNFLIDFAEEEMDQPHSIIITESPKEVAKDSPNRTYDSHTATPLLDLNNTYDSHENQRINIRTESDEHLIKPIVNGVAENDLNEVKKPNSLEAIEDNVQENSHKLQEDNFEKNISQLNNEGAPKIEAVDELTQIIEPVVNNLTLSVSPKTVINGSFSKERNNETEIKCNGSSEKYATVEFLNETFEELLESNVDDETKDFCVNDKCEQVFNQDQPQLKSENNESHLVNKIISSPKQKISENIDSQEVEEVNTNGVDDKLTSVTENFLLNEKKFCQFDSYLPLLSDIRFTGPAEEIMTTSFTQDSPTEPTSPEYEQDSKPDTAVDILKEWDSDSDSHSSNSSSGEFIWKDGDGHETSVVPSTHFDHQRGSNSESGAAQGGDKASSGAPSEASGDSGSGSEGDEVEFVPSSWDCRAAPSKSSLRSFEQATPEHKKRVVFKRQKYHCVYEYPREVADVETHSPAAYMPDFSTYSDWDPSSAEEAELGYGQLFGTPNALDLYPLRAGIAFGADYDEDFFISSSARPFESLGIMTTTSQFFPGMHVKPALLERELDDVDDFPPPPSPLPTVTATASAPTAATATLVHTRTPSLDFTTPDSGVEDITPGSTTTEEDYKIKKLSETEVNQCWRPVDSGSSSESVSPSSPGGEALGGLRHTRDKLKLDLPPSPHLPSPRHNRVFNFVLDKPKRQRVQEERSSEVGSTPLVMSDETPVVSTSLPLQESDDLSLPEPTFSTFGKCAQKVDTEQKSIILTEDVQHAENSDKVESPKVVEAVKGEGTVLDSGDEDSGIESSSKATLERNKTTPNIS
ncbi:uncharacterized protein LOC113513209 isoform X3 [Galleria mellonella]|uniref:Uncharacterized protein LOC113513209 isoform X3 n=1 Tax=Galleria mellonella TaxID=7137 RepID=A0ABM3N7G1_GALME|nr:uncharacterized protein LOC113513209 isoform X3 [Galleria mellonella]